MGRTVTKKPFPGVHLQAQTTPWVTPTISWAQASIACSFTIRPTVQKTPEAAGFLKVSETLCVAFLSASPGAHTYSQKGSRHGKAWGSPPTILQGDRHS